MEILLLKMQLENYLVKRPDFSSRLSVDNIAHLQARWESDICAFDLTSDIAGQERTQELILCIYPGADAR